jgi:hypothetical protein
MSAAKVARSRRGGQWKELKRYNVTKVRTSAPRSSPTFAFASVDRLIRRWLGIFAD